MGWGGGVEEKPSSDDMKWGDSKQGDVGAGQGRDTRQKKNRGGCDTGLGQQRPSPCCSSRPG